MTDFDFKRLKSDFIGGARNAAESVSSAARDVSSDVKRYKKFADVGKDLFASGATTSHGGNISETDGKSIWITRRGAMLAHLGSPSSTIETSWDQSSMDAEASIELIVHRAIYHAIAGAEKPTGFAAAIIHAHPAHTIARSLIDDEIRPLDSEGKLILGERVPVIRADKTIASNEVALQMRSLISPEVRIIVVAGHGPFAVAPTLDKAFMLISCLERSSEIINIVANTKA